jgi:flagellar protein FliO/FliZ
MSPLASYLVETGVTLLAVVALAVLILVGAKRLGVGRPVGPMQLLGRLPLDARRSVCLVKIGQRVLVLGVSEAGLTKLAQLRADQIPESIVSPGPSFGDVLGRLRGRAPRSPSQSPTGSASDDGVEAEDNR